MNLLPRFKECPCCGSLNLFKVNGITYENNFKSLSNWTLKKLINCRKCKIEFGLFINKENKKTEKVVWIELFQCEDVYLDELTKLQMNKEKHEQKNRSKKYKETLLKIQNILNKIRLDKIKVKIKVKVKMKSKSQFVGVQ